MLPYFQILKVLIPGYSPCAGDSGYIKTTGLNNKNAPQIWFGRNSIQRDC